MKNFHILLLLCSFIITYACKSSVIQSDCQFPSGKYFNSTVLDACPGKMPSDIPHYALEMSFHGKDSVTIDNGFERYNLAVKPGNHGCQYVIAAATLFGDMKFEITSDSTIELIDTAWTKVAGFSGFSKVNESDVTFREALNDCLVSGEYTLFTNGEIQIGVVTLLPNGQLNGMKPFIGYEVCFAGDCLEETTPPSRTITLIDDAGNRETFSMKPLEGKMALELYSLSAPVPDVKGERTIGPMLYELRTE